MWQVKVMVEALNKMFQRHWPLQPGRSWRLVHSQDTCNTLSLDGTFKSINGDLKSFYNGHLQAPA